MIEVVVGIIMGIGLVIQYFIIEYQDRDIKELKAYIKNLKGSHENNRTQL
jgi:hypothetical protein